MLLHLIQLYRQIFTITSSETINLHFTNQNTKIKKQKPKDLKGQWLRSYFVTKKNKIFCYYVYNQNPNIMCVCSVLEKNIQTEVINGPKSNINITLKKSWEKYNKQNSSISGYEFTYDLCFSGSNFNDF
jgi:hypothetical protein